MNKSERNLFVCSSKYTILNSVNAVLNKTLGSKSKSDIVIFQRTLDLKNISDKLKTTGIFQNVFLFPFIDNIGILSKIKLFIFPKPFLKKISLDSSCENLFNTNYDNLITQSLLYASLFGRLNKNFQLFLIEEGLSTYTQRTYDPTKRSYSFNLVNYFFFKGSLSDKGIIHLVYKPNMLLNKKNNILKLPKIKKKFSSFFNDIFDYKYNSLYKKNKLIYLGVPFFGLKDLMVNKKDAPINFETQCKDLIFKLINIKKKLVYRPHPLELLSDEYNGLNFRIDNFLNMWESECQNIITNQHVLISFFSSACFTPKILFGKEPFVILLYKFFDVEFYNADLLSKSLLSIYNDKRKVILVENFDQLINALDYINSLCDESK